MKVTNSEDRFLGIVTGAGRTGSTSAAILMNVQKDSKFRHEACTWGLRGPGEFQKFQRYTQKVLFAPVFKWEGGWDEHAAHLQRLANIPRALVGDAGMYYLPHVERIIEFCQQVLRVQPRFICLERDHNKIVKSFMDRTQQGEDTTVRLWDKRGTGNYQIWGHDLGIAHMGKKLDVTFPSYETDPNDPVPNLTACTKYVEDFYVEAHRLAKKYPAIFKMFETNDLNTETGVHGMLEHFGVPKSRRVIKANIVANTRDPLVNAATGVFSARTKRG